MPSGYTGCVLSARFYLPAGGRWVEMPYSNFQISQRFAMAEAFPPENKQKEKNPSNLPPSDLCAIRMELAPFGPELGTGSPINPACKVWVFLIH